MLDKIGKASVVSLLIVALGSWGTNPAEGQVFRKIGQFQIEAKQFPSIEKTILTEDHIFILSHEGLQQVDRAGELHPRVMLASNQRMLISDDVNYYAILTYSTDRIDQFELKRADGEVLWSERGKYRLGYQLSAKVGAVIGIDCEGQFPRKDAVFTYTFYGSQGEELAQVKCPSPRMAKFSPDGEMFVTNSSKEGLTCFDMNGEKQWAIQGNARHFEVSNQAEILIVSLEDQREQAILFKEGEEASRIELKGNVRGVDLSSDGQFAIISSRDSAIGIFTKEGRKLFTHLLEDQSETVNSIALTSGGLFAIGIQKRGKGKDPWSRYKQGRALVLDRSGKPILEQALSYPKSNAWLPEVAFDSTGKRLLVRTQVELLTFEIER
jgi:hypothetical protein